MHLSQIFIYFIWKDRIFFKKQETAPNNLDGILPNSGKRKNSYTGRRKSSLSKLAEIDRAQIFRERAKLTTSRPEFKLSKKNLVNLYPQERFLYFEMPSLFGGGSPRADTVSSASHCRMLMYEPQILAMDDTLDLEIAERKNEDLEAPCSANNLPSLTLTAEGVL